MSTANKLSYLNDTKSLLRTSLNKFGSSILSTDTFRSYDTKLNEIYDKLPKVTATGQGLTITPVQNGLLDDFKMIGVDLEQDTTTGKQLFDINSEINTNSLIDAGITSTFNEDGTITVNGEKTANYKYIRYYVTLPAGTYYFCGCPSGGSNSSYSSLVQLTQDTSSQVFDIGNGGTFTLTEQTTIQYFPVRVGNANLTFNNTIFKPMISTTPVTYDDFEKYTGGIASPNPNYPQEIKVVEGRQVITNSGKNLLNSSKIEKLTRNGITCSYNSETQEITFNGTCTLDNTLFQFNDINIYAKKNVTKFIVYYVSGTVENYFKLRFYDSNYMYGIIMDVVGLSSLNNKISSYSDDRVNTSNYTINTFRFNNGSVANNLRVKVMVTDDDNTDYEPYYNPLSYNIDLNLANIYLAKIPNTDYKNRIYKNNGNWYYERNVEKYIIDGTESWTTQSAYSGYYRYMFVLMENYKNDNLSYGVVGMNSHFIQRITQPHGDYEYLYLQAANNNLLSVYIQIKNLSTIANFKTWLSENNVVVWYVLANPVTTQITNATLISQLEAISVHTGTNIIELSSDNNMTPQIEITRLKELERLT